MHRRNEAFFLCWQNLKWQKIAICILALCYGNILSFKITIAFAFRISIYAKYLANVKNVPPADGKKIANDIFLPCQVLPEQKKQASVQCQLNGPPTTSYLVFMNVRCKKKMRAYSLPKVSIAMFYAVNFHSMLFSNLHRDDALFET